ncbi:MAG TPA: DUF4129 domain-containing protein [Thermoanaerobaculia bacterium]|nr:DUF4129 domain-containing protein [Thermoanaerobaculia bacterium]
MRRLLLAVLLLLAASARSETMTVAQYVASLEQIHAHLAAKQFQPAKTEAMRIGGMEVQWAQGTFLPDQSLLEAVKESERDDYRLRERLLITADEIRRAAGLDTGPVDPKMLRAVANEQKVPDLVSGGEIVNPVADEPLLEQIAESIAEVFRWLTKKIVQLLEWLAQFFIGEKDGDGGTSQMRWIVIAVAGAIVLLVIFLAVQVLRRSRAAKPERVESAAPIGSTRDEDPLSRGATEWERYAAQLAAAGRYREAIRAWYHAVLVTCYAAGALHFRKGRTNWEYLATLAPSLPWRPEMIELTRRFEQEWYGSDASSEDALDLCSTRAKSILEALHQRSAA